jgi:hypothetical protein
VSPLIFCQVWIIWTDQIFYLAHQVTDILRAKLLHQASQLADAQARVKELEEQSLAKLFVTAEDNKRHIGILVDLGEYLSWQDIDHLIVFSGKDIQEVTAKLVVRDKEALDALVTSASLEANLEAISRE